MKFIEFIRDYWTQLVFFVGIIYAFFKMFEVNAEATKCSLRNDILEIYNECKEKKEVTLYQLQAIEMSYSLYKKLKGNSFVDTIVAETRKFKRIN